MIEDNTRAARASRFERVRLRLGHKTRPSMARAIRQGGRDINQNTYVSWETTGAEPSAPALMAAYRALGVWDLDRLVGWLADGEGREPRWLSDLTLDPTKEPVNGNPPRPGSPSGIAMPHAILEHARKALEATRVARAALANVADPGPSAWAKAALNDTAEAATKALDALSSLPSSFAPNKDIPGVSVLRVA